MPRYSLRALIVLMLLGGPLCAWGWREWLRYRARAVRPLVIPLLIGPEEPFEGALEEP